MLSPKNQIQADPASVLHTLRLNGATYQLRRINCGKPNCKRCNVDGRRIPSHGPYWYLSWTYQGRTRRKYLGKDLDTRLYRDRNGNLDEAALLRPPSKEDPLLPGDTPALETRARLDALEDKKLRVSRSVLDSFRAWWNRSETPVRPR